jgi:hypothetical protein
MVADDNEEVKEKGDGEVVNGIERKGLHSSIDGAGWLQRIKRGYNLNPSPCPSQRRV